MRLLAFRSEAERRPVTQRLMASLCADRRRSAALGIFLGLACHVGVHAQASAAAVQLSVADYRAYLPQSHSVRLALQEFAGAVARTSQGQMQVEVLPGTIAGNPREQIDALRQGQPGAPQLMLLAATGLSELEKQLEIFDLPYAVRDEAQVESIVEGAQGQALLASLQAHGLVGLAWMENGFRQVSTAGAQLEQAADFKGLKIRTLPALASQQAFAAWGAQPVALAAAQVHSALRAGSVQAQEGFVTQLVQSRLHEVQKHLWLTNHSYGAQALVVRADVWQALNAAQKNVLSEAARAAARTQRLRSRAEVRDALEILASQGMQIHAVSRATVDALAVRTRHLRPQDNARLAADAALVSHPDRPVRADQPLLEPQCLVLAPGADAPAFFPRLLNPTRS